MKTIEFLTTTGQTCTPIRQEFILLSDVMGVSALVDAINNPPVNGATSSSVLGPFFTEDAPDSKSTSLHFAYTYPYTCAYCLCINCVTDDSSQFNWAIQLPPRERESTCMSREP